MHHPSPSPKPIVNQNRSVETGSCLLGFEASLHPFLVIGHNEITFVDLLESHKNLGRIELSELFDDLNDSSDIKPSSADDVHR